MFTFDGANTGFTENDIDGTVTILSHAVGSLVDGALFVWVVWQTNTITGVTHNGVAMIPVVSQSTNRMVALYWLPNPASGVNNIVITGSGALGRVVAGCHSWDGVNSVQSPTIATNSGTSTNPNVTPATGSDKLIIDVLGIAFTAGETVAVDANQTERGNLTGGATRGASSSQLGSDGGAMSWTNSASRAWGMVAASFDPAPSGAAATVDGSIGVIVPVTDFFGFADKEDRTNRIFIKLHNIKFHNGSDIMFHDLSEISYHTHIFPLVHGESVTVPSTDYSGSADL